jgi:hypothetical protein
MANNFDATKNEANAGAEAFKRKYRSFLSEENLFVFFFNK